MNSPLFFANASKAGGGRFCLRVAQGRMAGSAPKPGDLTIDLTGRVLRPGLINAHDHLQLNSLPRLKYRPLHANVSEWIADIGARLAQDPTLRANTARPKRARLLAGALKNLLAGTTTVAHHDAWDPCFEDAGFPVNVPRCAWSHSLGLDGREAVRAACHAAPQGVPWIVHAAEGVDAAAGLEFSRLDELDCIGPQTVLVHGLALNAAQRARLVQAGAGLVWCPASNLHLFEKTIDPHALAARGRLALGSDSRISGSRDLLDELAIARQASRLGESALESLVTDQAAALLRLPDRGQIAAGARADLMALPAGLPLSRARRADVELVVVHGEIRLADPRLPGIDGCNLLPVRLDGRPKLLSADLVAALQTESIVEPGLDLAPALETMP
ncbi:amidohydrolase family protein [Burkholderiaceae bacterium UC74_6]